MDPKEREKFWLSVATEVEKLISDAQRRKRFEEKIQTLLAMMDRWQHALAESARDALADPHLRDPSKSPGDEWEWEIWFEVSPDGSVGPCRPLETISGPPWRYWRRRLPTLPLLWWPLGMVGSGLTFGHDLLNAGTTESMRSQISPYFVRPPDETEKLIIDYLVLGIIHDNALPSETSPRVCLNLLGKDQNIVQWAQYAWWMLQWNEDREYNEGERLRAVVKCALAHVRADLGVTDVSETLRIMDRFVFDPGQALFDGKDLDLATELARDVLKKLAKQAGRVVSYPTLEEDSPTKEASEKLRTAVVAIRASLRRNKTGFEIATTRGTGYCLRKKTISRSPHDNSR